MHIYVYTHAYIYLLSPQRGGSFVRAHLLVLASSGLWFGAAFGQRFCHEIVAVFVEQRHHAAMSPVPLKWGTQPTRSLSCIARLQIASRSNKDKIG